MSVAGYGTGGASGTGPSTSFGSLPYRGYRELAQWFEEFVDAMGLPLDIWYQRFIKPASRANLLDPTYTPTDVADANLATATAAPTAAISRDTMLDVLAYIALGQYPLNTNLTVAQKQALTAVGWTALKRKGTRLQLLNLASKMTDGVAFGWTTPPFNFSIIVPDGEPSPGFGSWVQPLSANAETSRPWVLSAIRNTLTKGMFPDWSNLGVGFSQFRWGYSSWGETYFPSGARINILAHEHFDTWVGSVPTGWTKTGTGTLTRSTSDSSINWEFTGSAAVLDLTAQPSGTPIGLTQTAANVNNQLTHRFQLDYKYTNAQTVSTLGIQITDANRDGNTYYWNPTTATWGASIYTIPVPPSTTRGRFAFDVVPQAASATSTQAGTLSIAAKVFATSDGTATTQTTYTLYRAGFYEKFNIAIEQAALGERTLWLPLVDTMSWSVGSRTSVRSLIESANGSRSAYKAVSTGVPYQPYHPALGGRGFRAHSNWTNLILGSNSFTTDWTTSNATITNNAVISPIVGETVASASRVNATGAGAYLRQATGINPSNKSYVGGVWVKKLSADVLFTDVAIWLDAGGGTTFTGSYTVKQADGWTLLPVAGTFGAGDTGAMNFRVLWGQSVTNGQIAVADAYLYDVTGKAGVLYPPVVRSTVGATAQTGTTSCQAVTASQGVNVLHPLLLRSLASVVRGSLGLTIVPTFDATSQPNGVIFDLAKSAAADRVVLRVNSGVLELRRWDDAGNQWAASLTMSMNPSPVAGSVTWKRDQAITIHAIWDENSTMLSAGNGNASGTKPGSWAPVDTLVSSLTIGNDYTNAANNFDGLIRGVELVQLGAPIV